MTRRNVVMVDECISTVWRRGSLVLLCILFYGTESSTLFTGFCVLHFIFCILVQTDVSDTRCYLL